METLFDSELRLMEIIWEHQPLSAKEVSLLATEQLNWNKNTTYTVIKRLIEKKVLKRSEPGFICTSLINKKDMQKAETKTLIEKFYNGSKKTFFAAFSDEKLTAEEIEVLKSLIEKKEQ